MTRKQCYAILGIAEGASLDEVKRAYRKRAFDLHPDLNPAPDASKKFQRLNEAYVLMLSFLEEDNTVARRPQKQSTTTKAEPEATYSKAGSGEKFAAHSQAGTSAETEKTGSAGKPEATGAGNSKPGSETFAWASSKLGQKLRRGPFRRPEGSPEQPHGGFQFSKKLNNSGTQPETVHPKSSSSSGGGFSSGIGTFFNRQDTESAQLTHEEVLSGVLRDPFARRVFEDIYSEIRQSGKSAGKMLKEGGKDLAGILPLRNANNLVNYIKDWMRKQIDDEQTVAVPVHNLRPGMRIRLQVQHGMSGKTQNIEVTIPLDYTPGRPVRLKGLGRKIGPWLGDLYLRIVPKLV